jgi:CcmD family protein
VVNKFLFLAYAFVWTLFMAYAWSLSRRQTRLLREMEDLKARMGSTERSTTLREERQERGDERVR